MKLETKAFLVMFCGVVMFFWFTMLPVMYLVDDKILKLHDADWFVQFAIALVFISAVIAWMSVAMTADKDKDKRVVQLQLAINDGLNFILYWNPLGWIAFCSGIVAVYWKEVCPGDKDKKGTSGWGG